MDLRSPPWAEVPAPFAARSARPDPRHACGLERISTPLPPINEQRRIAYYLDAEAGRIEALIDKERRMTKFLRARRQALIAAAVTGGLEVPRVAA